MTHLPALIQDLGVILVTAALMTLLFKRLNQPVVLGYLIAGLLVGPHVTWVPTVVDTESVKVWAEIGVVFLLFGLGLEFSFKKLAAVGRSAAIAALFEIGTMTAVGYLVGQAFGWSSMDSLFLGAILSMSSTTIIIRAFGELGLKAQGFVALVFGVLIVEDLAAILILVLLATLAAPGGVSGGHLAYSAARLGFFLLLWFVVGIFFVPALLRRCRRLLSDETLLVVAIGLCLVMVLTATTVGFSPALGAFVMGSILAETREGPRIEHLLLPVRDLFAAVFFVSVGMMIDPHVLVENAGIIAIIIAVTIVGKLVGSGMGALLSGRSLRTSLQAGLSLAQIGEFSFLIAALGESLEVTSPFLYPIVIAVSAVTTFTTPYMIKMSEPLGGWIERHIPKPVRARLSAYEAMMATEGEGNGLKRLWRDHGMMILLNVVVALGLSLAISQGLLPKLEDALDHPRWLRGALCFATLAACSPFLWAILRGRPRTNDGAAVPIRILAGALTIGAVVGQFTSLATFSGIALVAFASAAVTFSRFAEPLYNAVERRFLANLSGDAGPRLAPWNASLAEVVVSSRSEFAGKRLDASAFRERTGANVAVIERGGEQLYAPGRDAVLWPFDRLTVVGTDEQLARARELAEVSAPADAVTPRSAFGLGSLLLDAESALVGKTIRECGLRETVRGLIVGIERGGERLLNPGSEARLAAGDRLWIVGDQALLRKLKAGLRPVSA